MLSKIKKYRHGFIIAIYFVAYLILFGYLEQRPVRAYHVVHTVFDDMIPFCEIFIIPYLLWFPYVVITVVYFLFRNKNKKEYFQLIFNLMMGMTVFLVVSYIYPNVQYLRPAVFPRSNIFTRLVAELYRTDTPTNILPSIHVFNSLAVYFAIHHCQALKDRKWLQRGALILSVLIILSTMFIKQHSVIDVGGALRCMSWYHTGTVRTSPVLSTESGGLRGTALPIQYAQEEAGTEFIKKAPLGAFFN